MKFTASVMLAVNTALELQQGTLRVWLKGQEEEFGRSDSRILLSRPSWTNFLFFRKIDSSFKPRQRVEPQGEQAGYWVKEQVVQFYHGSQKVCVVTLRGKEYDYSISERKGDDKTWWAVETISYADSVTPSTTQQEVHLVTFELLPTGYELVPHAV